MFDEGAMDEVNVLLSQYGAASGFRLFLIVDTNPLLSTDTISNHTECSLSGYIPRVYAWSDIAFSVASGVVTWTLSPFVNTFAAYAGGTTIYGYIVKNELNGKLIWGELLPAPYVVPAGGGSLTLNIVRTSGQCA